MFTGILLKYELIELEKFREKKILSFSRENDEFYITTEIGTIIINIGEYAHIRYIDEKLVKEKFFSTYLEGKKIIDFQQEGLDRILNIFVNGIRIKILFFGRHSNLIIYKDERLIFSIKEIKKETEIDGVSIESPYAYEEIIRGGKIKGLTKTFLKNLKNSGIENIKEFLKLNFSPCYNENIVSPFYIPNFEKAETINEAISLFIKAREKRSKELDWVEKKIKSLKMAIDELSKPIQYEHYKVWGELILANQHLRPENPLKIKNFNGEDVIIPIDLSKSLKENAEEYFKLYRKGKSREEKRLKMIENIEKKIESLRTMDIKEKEKRKEERKRFKEFKTTSGLIVLVGRSAKENEELTFKRARKFDYFFHVREAPGAHTILFLKDKNTKPGKKDIEEAAMIAAKNSRARTSSIVPVSYTEVRYVRKLKGKLGGVILTKEKVLFVKL